MLTALTYINLILALVTALFGALALMRPKLVNPGATGDADERFFVEMYAARAVPLGLAAGIAPLFFGGWPVALILFAAALTQAADIAIAGRRGITGMLAGAAIAALVHAALGVMLIV